MQKGKGSMLNLWGSILLIAAGMLAGCAVSDMYKRRILLHKKLLRMYSETAILLEYSLMTFGEIVEHFRTSGEYNEFSFLSVDSDSHDIRQAVLDGIDAWNSGLEYSAVIGLKSFFQTLGTTDIQGQLSYARLAALSQQRLIESVEDTYRQKSRFSRTFGTLFGAFAAIMLI